MMASEVNRLHKILDDSGIRWGIIFSDIQGLSAQEVIEGLINAEPVEVLLSKLKRRTKKHPKFVYNASAIFKFIPQNGVKGNAGSYKIFT